MSDLGTLEMEFVIRGQQVEAQMAAIRREVANDISILDKQMRKMGNFDNLPPSAKRAGVAINSLARETANIGYQFSDIAVQLQSGTSPFTVALQQGTELGAIFSGAGGGLSGAIKGVGAAFVSLLSPVNLVTIGLIAAGGAAVQYFMGKDEANALSEALKKQPEIINAIKAAWGDAAKGIEGYSAESRNVVRAMTEDQAKIYREGISKAANEAVDSIGEAFNQSDAISGIASLTAAFTGPGAAGPSGLDALKKAADDLKASAKDDAAILAFRDTISQIANDTTAADTVRAMARELLTSTKEAGDAARALQVLTQAETQLSDTTRVMVGETKRFNDLLSQGLYNEAAKHAQTLGQALQAAAATQKALNAETNRFASERLANAGQGYEALNDYYVRKAAGISGEAYSPSSGILDLIAQAEGTKNRRGYNETLDYGRWTGGDRNLTMMTLDQIDALQTQMLANPQNRALYGNGRGSSALGRYMTTRKTLRGMRSQLGLKGTDFFTPELQDRIAQEIVRQTDGDVSKLQGRWEGLKRVDSSVISTAMGNSSLTMSGRDQAQEQRLKTYDDLMKSGELYIAEQMREATAVTQTSEVAGLASEQSRKLGYEQEMLNRILALGVQVTPQQADAISDLASRMASAETETQRLRFAQDDLRQAQQDVKDSTRDAMKGFISDLIEGKSASEALSNALSKVGDTMLNIGLNYLLTGSASGQGAGGFLGWLFKGFDGGGYTGAGGKYEPKGVVHGNEFVFDADSTSRIGVGNLEAMRKAAKLPGYANGGFVSTSFPAPSTFMARQQPTNVVVSVDDNGNLQAFVRRESGAQVRAAAPGIVSTSVKMAGGRVVPTMAAYQAQKAGGDYRNG